MQTVLTENEDHKLTLEKTAGQWRLELIERKTGLTRICYFNRKDQAQAFCKGMALPDIKRLFEQVLKIEPVKMYKEGV